MKKALTFLIFISLMSCEIDDCQTCTVIIEDNFAAADRACLGLPSAYPNGYEVLVEFTEEYCGQALDDILLKEGEIFEPFCPGIVASQITWVICE